MEVTVRGKRCEVPSRLEELAREKLPKLEKFTADIVRAEVDFSEEKNPRIANHSICEITVHLARHTVKARGAAPDANDALDRALHRAEYQLQKLHSKRVTRRRRAVHLGAMPVEPAPGTPMLVEARFDEESESGEGARIVRTKTIEILAMEPEEAALQMDLLGHEFFFFTNVATGRASVVYRRRDGDLGVIEAS